MSFEFDTYKYMAFNSDSYENRGYQHFGELVAFEEAYNLQTPMDFALTSSKDEANCTIEATNRKISNATTLTLVQKTHDPSNLQQLRHLDIVKYRNDLIEASHIVAATNNTIFNAAALDLLRKAHECRKLQQPGQLGVVKIQQYTLLIDLNVYYIITPEELSRGNTKTLYKAVQVTASAAQALGCLTFKDEIRLTKDGKIFEEAIKRFINSPNVAPEELSLYDKASLTAFMVTPLKKGSISNLYKEKDLTWTKLVDIYQQVCRGMQDIHNAHLVHGSLHNENALYENLGDRYKITIIDFGSAKIDSKESRNFFSITDPDWVKQQVDEDEFEDEGEHEVFLQPKDFAEAKKYDVISIGSVVIGTLLKYSEGGSKEEILCTADYLNQYLDKLIDEPASKIEMHRSVLKIVSDVSNSTRPTINDWLTKFDALQKQASLLGTEPPLLKKRI